MDLGVWLRVLSCFRVNFLLVRPDTGRGVTSKPLHPRGHRACSSRRTGVGPERAQRARAPPLCRATHDVTGRRPLPGCKRRHSTDAQTPLLPMGSCQAGHNLHLCLAHHPPLVCATLILLLLGLSGLGLGGFLLTHTTGLRSPDIPQDWVSFLRSFGQLSLCPMNETVTGKWRGPHVIGVLTTLNFGDDPDRNKTQTFQAKIHGSQIGLKGSFARESVLVTARVASGRTPGTCLYFSGVPEILPSSQPPISCLEEGAGNATLSPVVGEECVRVWSHERLVLTKLLTSEELALCGSRLLVLGFFLVLLCGFLCCATAVCFHPRPEFHWSRTRL